MIYDREQLTYAAKRALELEEAGELAYNSDEVAVATLERMGIDPNSIKLTNQKRVIAFQLGRIAHTRNELVAIADECQPDRNLI